MGTRGHCFCTIWFVIKWGDDLIVLCVLVTCNGMSKLAKEIELNKASLDSKAITAASTFMRAVGARAHHAVHIEVRRVSLAGGQSSGREGLGSGSHSNISFINYTGR